MQFVRGLASCAMLNQKCSINRNREIRLPLVCFLFMLTMMFDGCLQEVTRWSTFLYVSRTRTTRNYNFDQDEGKRK